LPYFTADDREIVSIAKRIFGATTLITIAKAVVMVLTLFSAPILTRILGPGPYGTMALIASGSSFAVTLGLLGVDMSYARFFFAKQSGGNEDIERFCWRFSVGFSAIIAICACGILWTFYKELFGDGLLLISFWLMVVLGTVRIMAETRNRLLGSYKRIAAAIILSGIVTPATTITLAKFWRQDAWPLIIGALIGLALNISFLKIPALRSLFSRSALTLPRRKEVLGLGLPGIFTATMYWVMSSSDRWFIASFVNQNEVGIYSFVFNLASAGMMLNSAITLTWFPEAVRHYEENSEDSAVVLGRLWARLVVSLLLVWLITVSFGGDLLQLLADKRFHLGYRYIPWLAGGVFFYGLSSLANTSLMLAKNMRPAAYCWILAGGMNLMLNRLLVPTFGAYGAAIVNCFSFAFVAIVVLVVSQRYFALWIPFKNLFIVGSITIIAGYLFSPSWCVFPMLSILLKIPAAMFCSSAILFMIAPDWVKRIVKFRQYSS